MSHSHSNTKRRNLPCFTLLNGHFLVAYVVVYLGRIIWGGLFRKIIWRDYLERLFRKDYLEKRGKTYPHIFYVVVKASALLRQ